MRKTEFLFLLGLSLLLVVGSCKKDLLEPVCDGTEATYDGHTATIINATCMGSSCHDAGSNRGDFTTYEGIKPYLDDGSFTKEVLTNQSMPRGSVLSQSQINTMQCWLDNGYAEN